MGRGNYAHFLPLLVLALLQIFPLAARACPLCHSSTAEEVRAGLIATSLDGITIPALILPLASVALVVCAIQIDWDERSKFRLNKKA